MVKRVALPTLEEQLEPMPARCGRCRGQAMLHPYRIPSERRSQVQAVLLCPCCSYDGCTHDRCPCMGVDGTQCQEPQGHWPAEHVFGGAA